MAARAPARIVLADEDTMFLQLMRNLLEASDGYQVVVKPGRTSAYQLVKEQRPDLVILDIRITGEEAGWTILELLRLDPATRLIPLVVCSPVVRGLHRHERYLRRYEVRVLPKPFDLETLLAAVRQALATSGGLADT